MTIFKPQYRLRRTGIAILMAALLLTAWVWLSGEKNRLQKANLVATASRMQMQSDIEEIKRLRGQPALPHPSGQTLANAIGATLLARHCKLGVTVIDSAHVQLLGVAGFDDTINGLATVQHELGVRVTSLKARRQGNEVSIDAVLAGN